MFRALKIFAVILCVMTLAACQTASKDFFPRNQTLSVSDVALKPDSKILVLYIGAKNCPPCYVWKEKQKPSFVASPEYKQVIYREVTTSKFQYTSDPYYWPEDLKWIVKKTDVDRGAPRFVVAVDNKVVSNQWSRKKWRENVVPFVRSLVSKKAAL